MDRIIRYAISAGASDIHITEGKDGWVRIKGNLTKFSSPITISEIDEFVELVIPGLLPSYKDFRENKSTVPLDGAFKYLDRRFRFNIYRSYNGVNIAIRIFNDHIMSMEELYLPKELENFTKIKSGLFLVVGTTGSGKTTTLASMLDRINRYRSENIITIEQPIEYIHPMYKSRVEQIEVGTHVPSFDEAVKAAMRQDPNIVLLGEMRDLNTIQNAIRIAETGHVVYATLHAKSVTETVDRVIDVFPAKQQEQIRLEFAMVLKGILHQTLVRSQDGCVTPLIELLAVDDVVSAMILGKQKSNTIRDHLRGKSLLGNVHIADNAAWHIKEGRLDIEDVKPYLAPDEFSMVKSLVNTQADRRGF